MRAVSLLVLVLAGCVHAEITWCADGTLCPGDRVCDVTNGGCVLQEQLETCIGFEEATVCKISGQSDGICFNGVCVAQYCGDGRRTGGEQCDRTSVEPADTMTTCEEFDFYETTPVACDDACRWVIPDTCVQRCGDGALQGRELCEENIAVGGTCLDFGYDRGGLGCTECRPNFSACGVIGWQSTPLGFGTMIASDIAVVGEVVYLAFGNEPVRVVRYEAGVATELGSFPVPATRYIQLEIAVSPTGSVWVLGVLADGTGLLSMWDGTTWVPKYALSDEGKKDLLIAGGSIFASADRVVYHSAVTDGSSFVRTTLATPAQAIELAGTSESDVYATGNEGIAHWDGAQWSDVTLPKPLSGSDRMWSNSELIGGVLAVVARIANRDELWLRTPGQWTTHLMPYRVDPARVNPAQITALAANDIYVLLDDQSSAGAFIVHFDGEDWAKLEDFPKIPLDTMGHTTTGRIVGHAFGQVHAFGGSAWSIAARLPSTFPQLWAAGDRVYAALGVASPVLRFDGGDIVWSNVAGNAPAAERGAGFGADLYTFPFAGNAIDHFDGTTWGPSTPISGQVMKHAIAVRARDDVYVGIDDETSGVQGVAHFNGSGLDDITDFDSPAVKLACAQPQGACYAVLANGSIHWKHDSASLWAPLSVGFSVSATGQFERARSLVVFADGSVMIGTEFGRVARGRGDANWSIDEVDQLEITNIAGASPTDVFAFGFAPNLQLASLSRWDGTRWLKVRMPLPLTATPDMVAVGSSLYISGNGGGTPLFGQLERVVPWP